MMTHHVHVLQPHGMPQGSQSISPHRATVLQWQAGYEKLTVCLSELTVASQSGVGRGGGQAHTVYQLH